MSPTAKVPTKAYQFDAGWDLYASEDAYIPAARSADIPTGIEISIPAGYFGRITGRSSTLSRRGLLVSEGIIDALFHGHLFFNVLNISSNGVQILTGERLAQILFLPVIGVDWLVTDDFPHSERQKHGFGSSGF